MLALTDGRTVCPERGLCARFGCRSLQSALYLLHDRTHAVPVAGDSAVGATVLLIPFRLARPVAILTAKREIVCPWNCSARLFRFTGREDLKMPSGSASRCSSMAVRPILKCDICLPSCDSSRVALAKRYKR